MSEATQAAAGGDAEVVRNEDEDDFDEEDEEEEDEEDRLEAMLGEDRMCLYDSISSFFQGSVQAAACGRAKDALAYAHMMRRIAEQSVVRFTPAAKSAHCRRCDSVILDGIAPVAVPPPAVPSKKSAASMRKAVRRRKAKASAEELALRSSPVRVRIRKGRLVRTCVQCGHQRRVPMPNAQRAARSQRRRAQRRHARRRRKRAAAAAKAKEAKDAQQKQQKTT